MSKQEFAPQIARAVFPGVQWGPHENLIAAKAVAFWEALQPEFKEYAKQVVQNAQILWKELQGYGFSIISGGTDNHLLLIDVFGSKGVTGKEAEVVLEQVGISCNKNMIPYDERKPLDPSGIRVGTPAVTTRWMKEEEMKQLAKIMNDAIEYRNDMAKIVELKNEIKTLCNRFPIYR